MREPDKSCLLPSQEAFVAAYSHTTRAELRVLGQLKGIFQEETLHREHLPCRSDAPIRIAVVDVWSSLRETKANNCKLCYPWDWGRFGFMRKTLESCVKVYGEANSPKARNTPVKRNTNNSRNFSARRTLRYVLRAKRHLILNS